MGKSLDPTGVRTLNGSPGTSPHLPNYLECKKKPIGILRQVSTPKLLGSHSFFDTKTRNSNHIHNPFLMSAEIPDLKRNLIGRINLHIRCIKNSCVTNYR